jgi:hypothetical protein
MPALSPLAEPGVPVLGFQFAAAFQLPLEVVFQA